MPLVIVLLWTLIHACHDNTCLSPDGNRFKEDAQDIHMVKTSGKTETFSQNGTYMGSFGVGP